MSEPIFIRQRLQPASPKEGMDWVRDRADEARALGCLSFRVSQRDGSGDVLFEGWAEKAAEQGPPRWQDIAVQAERERALAIIAAEKEWGDADLDEAERRIRNGDGPRIIPGWNDGKQEYAE